MGLLIDWFGNNDSVGIYGDKRDGYILVSITFVLLIAACYGFFRLTLQTEYTGYKIQTQCTTMIYKKIL